VSKLTREDKIKIYERRKNGETIPSLAKAFNVQESNIKYLIALRNFLILDIFDIQSQKKLYSFTFPIDNMITGFTENPHIISLRKQQIKNMLLRKINH